jgi:hypothetical protein
MTVLESRGSPDRCALHCNLCCRDILSGYPDLCSGPLARAMTMPLCCFLHLRPFEADRAKSHPIPHSATEAPPGDRVNTRTAHQMVPKHGYQGSWVHLGACLHQSMITRNTPSSSTQHGARGHSVQLCINPLGSTVSHRLSSPGKGYQVVDPQARFPRRHSGQRPPDSRHRVCVPRDTIKV